MGLELQTVSYFSQHHLYLYLCILSVLSPFC
jgi:hypothetical protein